MKKKKSKKSLKPLDQQQKELRAGFDGLEIHGAHGYLIAQFMSPHTNKRRDKYGGNLENRMRFPVEVIESVKRSTGTSYPVGFRFSGDEHIEDGINLEMSKEMSRILEESGVSYLHVSCGSGEPGVLSSTRPADHPRGYNIHLAAGVKEVVHIPVIAVGALDDPQIAADTIVKGKADLVAIGRGLLADAYWPIKVMEGKLKDIQYCTRCNFCMRIRQGKEIRCPVNPALV